MNSPFVQILAFVFDLPSVSYESFYKTMMSLYFILGIVGCFGYYLFLKYAAGITWIFSLFGGFLFFFGTGPFISTILSGDGGIFLSSFAITPYVMLFISLAFGKSDCYLYSAWAGLALASQFFFFGPHPEGTIYSFLFNSIYATGFIIFSKQHDLRTKIIISLTFIVSFCMLSAFMLVPIFVDVLTHNIYVFTHLNDIRRINLSLFTPYIIILVCSLPISYRLLKKRMDAVYSSSRFLAICLLVFLLLAARPHVFLLPLIKLTHVGLHFNYYWRYGAYFTLSVYTIFIYMLDESTKRIVNKFYG